MKRLTTRRIAPVDALVALGASTGVAHEGAEAATQAPDTAYMAWRGTDSDPKIYWSRMVNGQWTPQQGFVGATAREPDLAYLNGRAYMVFRGNGEDNDIWWSSYNGSAWPGRRALVDRRTSGPPGMS
ncbi:hypothetical protein LG634_26340 [Streptomyces bambusae]|uniref:hypothetical protein n=1 Tax=Streptomyces bambusae TaxID=1550616 RepID=UPI001CFC948D|nr:hypothetical protein [Streptomyces bambusae]MCB5168332.1 hypothetical protein [Streptomyces bambusae]